MHPARAAVEGWRTQRLVRPRCSLPTNERAIALTFDDGPDPDFTPMVLDILAANNAHATFFVLGERVDAHPWLVQRMLREGHAVGSHSSSHIDTWGDPLVVVQDIEAGLRQVERIVTEPVTLFRPPHGQISLAMAKWIRSRDLSTWLWTRDPEDWHPAATAGSIVRACGDLVAGDVVVLHDGIAEPTGVEALDRGPTVEALPILLARIRDHSFRCVTLDA